MKTFRNITLFFVVLCAARFFTLSVFGETLVSNIELAGAMVLIAIIVTNSLLTRRAGMAQHFSSVFILLFAAVIVSSIACYFIYQQPIAFALIAFKIGRAHVCTPVTAT